MIESSKLLNRKEINSKTKQTLLDKYGVDAASKINLNKHTLEILSDKERFRSFVTNKNRQEVTSELEIADHTLYLYAKKYDAATLFSRPLLSQFEIEVSEFLNGLDIKFEQNSRNIISPKELDFYLPEHKLAIECSGLYWHSELSAGRGQNYHYDKHQACAKLGIQLITIFDDEWNNNQELIKRVLTNKLTKTNNNIFARKCVVKEITTKEYKEFINQNHIQQYAHAKVKLGLTYKDEVVAVMSFSKARYDKNDSWEMIRFCSSQKVTGGASKLLSYFLKTYNPELIISYSDNRWFTGDMYEKLNFNLTSESIGFFYTNYSQRFNRLQFQKHKLVKEGFDDTKTAWEIMQERKFDRIWDCGQKRWELVLKDK